MRCRKSLIRLLGLISISLVFARIGKSMGYKCGKARTTRVASPPASCRRIQRAGLSLICFSLWFHLAHSGGFKIHRDKHPKFSFPFSFVKALTSSRVNKRPSTSPAQPLVWFQSLWNDGRTNVLLFLADSNEKTWVGLHNGGEIHSDRRGGDDVRFLRSDHRRARGEDERCPSR